MQNNFSLISQEETHGDSFYVSGLSAGDKFNNYTDIITSERVAELMIQCVFGSVLAETDVVRSEEGVFSRYGRTLLSRIERGEDTGLAHRDVLLLWNMLSGDDKKTTAQKVVSFSDILDDFPPVEKLNVAYTMCQVHIDAGDYYIPAFVPAVVAIKTGLAVILPSISGVGCHQSAFCHLAYPDNEGVAQVHVWDLKEKKISKINGDDFLQKPYANQ